jgi:DNA-binding transcriptional LysR family regulator
MHQSPDQEPERLAASIAPRLALLRALARERNVTRAAAEAGIPQPTASRWLARLGASLGAPVTVRVGRRAELTPAGEALAETAGQALRVLAAGAGQAMAQADPDRGRVVFAFLHTMGGARVPGLLRGFRGEHPAVRFTLIQGAHEDVLGRVRAGEADLALTAPVPAGDPELTAIQLYRQPLVLVVPDGHRLAGRRRVSLAEVAAERFVGMKRGYGLRHITDSLCQAAGFTPDLSFEGEEVDTVRGLAAAGLGVAILPAADPPPPAGTAQIELSPPAARTIGLVRSARRPLPPAAQRFWDYIAGAGKAVGGAGVGSDRPERAEVR